MSGRWWRSAVGLLVLGVGLTAQAQMKVATITVTNIGPAAASDELVKANIRVKIGDVFNRAAVDDDVRTLYATGFFYNIRVQEDLTTNGVALTYAVQGKPRLTEIKFKGNTKYSSAKLSKKLTSKVGEPLDERKVFADTQTIKEKYQKAGYQKTTLKYTASVDENAGRATVTFEITEAPKIKIIDVVFDGAKAFPQKKLRKVIKTRRTWMFAWITGAGKLKDEQLADDKDKLADFYHNEGYVDFEIKDVTTETVTPKKMILRFIITEGQKYQVGTVGVKGNALFTTDKVLAALKMKVGATFTPKGLNKDLEAVENLYGARGYIDSKVAVRKIPNVEHGTMDLTYELVEGEKSYIEKIEIKGNVKTKDKVIRRELSVAPGEVFDMVKVKRSKTRLEQMNYFERVDARPEDTDVPNRKNLVVGVDEKSTGNFTVGAGFSTVDSLVGFVELTQGNFDLFKFPSFQGAGQKFRLRIAIGLERQDYVASFIEPWFLGRKLALGVDLYRRDWAFLSDAYDEVRTGMKVSLSRALGSDFLIGTISGTFEDIQIRNIVPANATPTIVDSAGSYLAARLGGSIAYDTRRYDTAKSGMLPYSGQRSEINAEVVGGDFEIYRVEGRTSWYFPGFASGHLWEIIGRVGVMDSLGKGIDVPNAANGPNKVPFFERYYLGGAYTLRGFSYRAVGPYEVNSWGSGEPIGGNTYYLASAEYSIPIIDRLRLAFFYDMGNVFYDSYQFDFGKFSADFGIGLRLNLPIGPLRLDYGYPVNTANHESTGGKFNFTVGFTRDY
jgi:outer membrane protein insertion porin family